MAPENDQQDSGRDEQQQRQRAVGHFQAKLFFVRGAAKSQPDFFPAKRHRRLLCAQNQHDQRGQKTNWQMLVTGVVVCPVKELARQYREPQYGRRVRK